MFFRHTVVLCVCASRWLWQTVYAPPKAKGENTSRLYWGWHFLHCSIIQGVCVFACAISFHLLTLLSRSLCWSLSFADRSRLLFLKECKLVGLLGTCSEIGFIAVKGYQESKTISLLLFPLSLPLVSTRTDLPWCSAPLTCSCGINTLFPVSVMCIFISPIIPISHQPGWSGRRKPLALQASISKLLCLFLCKDASAVPSVQAAAEGKISCFGFLHPRILDDSSCL